MDGKSERLSWPESRHEAGDGRDEDHIVTNWSAVGGYSAESAMLSSSTHARGRVRFGEDTHTNPVQHGKTS